MKKLLFILPLSFALQLNAQTNPQSARKPDLTADKNTAPQTADDIVKRYIQAMGGEEKLKSISTMKTSMKIKVQFFELPVSMTAKKDGSMKNETVFQGLTMVQAYDAPSKTGWYLNPMQGDKTPHKMNDEQLQQLTDNDNMIESPLLDYKAKGHTVELIGKEDLDGDDVYKIMLTKKNGNITYYYIDAQSFVIWKQETRYKFKDKEDESETYFSNYKTIDGYTAPYTIENYDDGKVSMQMNIDKIEYNSKVDDGMFKLPAAEAGK
jgi:hypothetical protein